VENTTSVTDKTRAKAAAMAVGLRTLADMIQANPHIAARFEHTFGYSGINAHLDNDGNQAAQQADLARIARRYGAKVTKDITDAFHNVILDFGGVKVDVLARREEVCERVVTGVETVTKTVPDPFAPLVEVIEEVETVEWVCRPLLAAEVGTRVTSS